MLAATTRPSRSGAAVKVAEVIAFLASDAAAHVTGEVPGAHGRMVV
jgi:NAD(P)-dependent dehydrogenase (short-subunit alcohol dehydrogenase family)